MILLAGMMRSFSTDEKARGDDRGRSSSRTARATSPRRGSSTNTTQRHGRVPQREDASLKSYGWADRKAGIAQIPIDAAMDLIAKNGLPRVKAPEPPKPAESKPAAEPKPAANEPARKE